MNSLARMEKWGETHHPEWIDFLRMGLGIFLVVKGAMYAEHNMEILNLLSQSKIEFLTFVAFEYVIYAQTIGGALLALGVVTRTIILFELPIAIATVFFINVPGKFMGINADAGYSILVLALLVVFYFMGSGKFSVDHYLNNHHDKFFEER